MNANEEVKGMLHTIVNRQVRPVYMIRTARDALARIIELEQEVERLEEAVEDAQKYAAYPEDE